MSPQGIAALEHHEGVVLKAYRDPVGIWTIGAGLTAASGVVKPKAGMVLTPLMASALLAKALAKNYEPAVAAAMPRALTHEFDAGVSFHFNTGAIRKATWVRLWRDGAAPAAIRAKLLAWNKAGGRVLPGLTRRREDEFGMLMHGQYPVGMPKTPPPEPGGYGRWGLSLSGGEKKAVWDAFRELGIDPGDAPHAIMADAVIRFQARHDLTVDGILGRATLSTLQRVLDARRKAKTAAPAAAAAAPAASTDLVDQLADVPHLGLILGGLAALYALRTAWSYRDVIAARVQPTLPRLAAYLRSF
jgi:lysozyme